MKQAENIPPQFKMLTSALRLACARTRVDFSSARRRPGKSFHHDLPVDHDLPLAARLGRYTTAKYALIGHFRLHPGESPDNRPFVKKRAIGCTSFRRRTSVITLHCSAVGPRRVGSSFHRHTLKHFSSRYSRINTRISGWGSFSSLSEASTKPSGGVYIQSKSEASNKPSVAFTV